MHCSALRLRLLPVLAEDLAAPDVVIAAVAEGLFALDPGLRVTGLHECALAGLVCHVHACTDLVQVQFVEAKPRAEGYCLSRDAPSPHRLFADDDAAFAVPIAPVDAADAGPSDRTAVDLDDPADRVSFFSHPIDEVLLLPDRHRADLQGEADHLGVLEPADVRRRLFVSRRPEGALLAAKDRTEHGRTLSSGSPRGEFASGRRGQRCLHLLGDLGDAVCETDPLSHELHPDHAEDLVQKGVLLPAMRTIVRRVVQLDRDHWFEGSGMTEDEIDVPSIDLVYGALIERSIKDLTEIDDSDLREDQVAIREDHPQHLVVGDLGRCEERLPLVGKAERQLPRSLRRCPREGELRAVSCHKTTLWAGAVPAKAVRDAYSGIASQPGPGRWRRRAEINSARSGHSTGQLHHFPPSSCCASNAARTPMT